MDQRIFHGKLTTDELARTLVGEFNRGNLRAQQLGSGKQVTVQIGTRDMPSAGGRTALTVNLLQVEDGISVQVGQQSWLGVAASLGKTAFGAFRNPFNLIGRLDDLASDIESLQLSEQVWQVIRRATRAAGVTHELSDRLKRMTCEYCKTANEITADRCIACGAPLGGAQPRTCLNCGFVVTSRESVCPNCQKPL
jgi:RNA polymerase subunit RPABC4/transcription elongation factor Spt4